MDKDSTLTANAAIIALRLTLEKFDEYLRDWCGNPTGDEWRKPSFTFKVDDPEYELMGFVADAAGIVSEVPFWRTEFYSETLVGPVAAFFEEGTGRVRVCLRRPVPGIYHALHWMIEDNRTTINSLTA